MSIIICAACDCVHNDDKNTCQAKHINLSDCYIMTMHDGRQHYQRCRDYERKHDELTESIEKFFMKAMLRGEQE